MLCLLRRLLWLKCCSECFYQTLKTGNRIPTQTGCPCDLFSVLLPYLGFILQRQQRNIHVAIAVTLFENVGFTVDWENCSLIWALQVCVMGQQCMVFEVLDPHSPLLALCFLCDGTLLVWVRPPYQDFTSCKAEMLTKSSSWSTRGFIPTKNKHRLMLSSYQ